jgi:TolB-like protein/tetratricopeptide (TPR) repeat protein
MASVFLSYDHEDAARAATIGAALQKAGHSVWWDREIHGGAEYHDEIESAVQRADAVVVLWSASSVKSPWVRDEAGEGRDQGKLVPVLLEPVKPPMGFRQYQTIDLSDRRRASQARQLHELMRAIAKMGAAAPSVRGAHSPDTAKRVADRRTVLAGGATAAALAAGIGGWTLLKTRSVGAPGSVAVLPFANLSGDPSQQYFSDGIAEEIRSALARLGGLTVIGRTSSEAVKGDDARTAAKKLSVAHVLTGSVRQSPSTVRVTAELVDGASGVERWSQDYDRPPGDAIRIQTDIAERVARSLVTALGAVARSTLIVGGTESASAQKFILQAEAASDGTKAGTQRAIKLSQAAIQIDPKYADAFAHKALYLNSYASNFAAGAAELFQYRNEAMRTANVALQLAPRLPSGHRAMAEINRVLLRLGPALAEFGRALRLAPADAGINSDYAFFSCRLGRFEAALSAARKGIALDPLNPASHFALVSSLAAQRRYAEAVGVSREIERSRPELFNWPEFVGILLALLGRFTDAERYLARATLDYARIVGEAVILAKTGRKSEIAGKIAVLRKSYGDAASYQFAQLYAQADEVDSAFKALGRAWEVRDSGLINLKVDELVDPLRNDPRFAGLLRKMNFPR